MRQWCERQPTPRLSPASGVGPSWHRQLRLGMPGARSCAREPSGAALQGRRTHPSTQPPTRRTAAVSLRAGEAPRLSTELPHPECKWYILDSHRPYNLNNVIEDDGRVNLLDDGEPNMDMDELVQQTHIMQDIEDEGYEEDEEEDLRPPPQRRRISADEYNALSPDSRAERRSEMRRLVKHYYAASWHGTSSAVILYSLVQALNKSSNDLLWLTIVGLTDQLVHERVEFEKYVVEAQQLQAEVASLNSGNSDEVTEVVDTDSGATVPVRQHISSSLRLDPVQELRVTLLRHWSLWDAIRHSPYIASRLGLYTQGGTQKLEVWLARMGLPLDECKQEYAYMRKTFKDMLFDKMTQYGSEFGLVNLTFPSFRRVTNYSTQMTPADLVHCVTAQLERPNIEGDEGDACPMFITARETLCHHSQQDDAIRDGLEKAKSMHRAIMTQGHAIITQKLYHNLGDFYKVLMRPGGDTPRFLHQHTLTKLALFIADALREGGQSNKKSDKAPKPVLLAAPYPDRGVHLVVAVLGSSRYWKGDGRNSFGKAFEDAAVELNAHIAHEGFESSMCQVASADLDNFLNGIVMKYDPTR